MKRPLRVAIIIDHFVHAQAGTENQVAKLLEGLSRDCEVDVIALREGHWLLKNAVRCGFTATELTLTGIRRASFYSSLWRLYRLLRRRRPDVVHTFFPISNIVGVLIARLAGVKTIYSSRRDYGEWMTPRYLSATRFANRFASGIITNSNRVSELTRRVEGISDDRIFVVPNGIDVQSVTPTAPEELRARLSIPSIAPVVGLVANYRPMKHHETLIRAAAVVLARRPDTHFVLVGQNMTYADIETQMRTLAAELGIQGNVHFTYSSGPIGNVLSGFDIGVNCSEGEGLSNAIIEYMAAGLPVIAADSGGNPDLVIPGRNGQLFPLGDHTALAGLILELLGDEARMQALRTGAAGYVQSELSLNAMLRRTRDVYLRGAAASRSGV